MVIAHIMDLWSPKVLDQLSALLRHYIAVADIGVRPGVRLSPHPPSLMMESRSATVLFPLQKERLRKEAENSIVMNLPYPGRPGDD